MSFIVKPVCLPKIYLPEDPEFYGQIPVRQEIEVLSADKPRQLKLGWVVSEKLGIGIGKRHYRICA